ncbi:hypothetical protein B0J13DRAFT_286595 [Dactylonectria estremocensis]|uniref:PPPDE domain-containing protein n=1 Tax=Dactylonectria estremocensis TaxID=1079267 RepID=A0A9P9F207_9HYPO|nr:hypothetical protein B0J13DRAFT_286595 [Dactylonectria estremocensis]
MPENDNEAENPERKRDVVGRFLYVCRMRLFVANNAPPCLQLPIALVPSENLTKGELALKHAAGLGHQDSVVPETDPVLDGPLRPVEVGWHPVGGLAGKWFAEQTGLGKMITEKIHKYPDPTQHWAVLVGDFAHQLWMDENFDVIYTNEKIKREEWRTFQVGETRFNDDATRRAGESVIQSIRDRQPGYNLITNNCQTYALQLLDAIKVGVRKEFGTTLAVYERLTGSGKVLDLFDKQEAMDGADGPRPPEENTVSVAQQVMNDNTTQLDAHEQMNRDVTEDEPKEEKEEKEGKFDSMFSRFKNTTLEEVNKRMGKKEHKDQDKNGDREERQSDEESKSQERLEDRQEPRDGDNLIDRKDSKGPEVREVPGVSDEPKEREAQKDNKFGGILSRFSNSKKSDTQEVLEKDVGRKEPNDQEKHRDKGERKEKKLKNAFSRFSRK